MTILDRTFFATVVIAFLTACVGLPVGAMYGIILLFKGGHPILGGIALYCAVAVPIWIWAFATAKVTK